jgi:2-oxoglutarate ferredoxin oxidoreductase subunit alpha
MRWLRQDSLRTPSCLWPFPSRNIRSSIGAATKAVAVYELNAGQMIDDVRLAVLGAAPVDAIGGASFDSSGFGIAPELEVDLVMARIKTALEAARGD